MFLGAKGEMPRSLCPPFPPVEVNNLSQTDDAQCILHKEASDDEGHLGVAQVFLLEQEESRGREPKGNIDGQCPRWIERQRVPQPVLEYEISRHSDTEKIVIGLHQRQNIDQKNPQ